MAQTAEQAEESEAGPMRRHRRRLVRAVLPVGLNAVHDQS